MGTAAPRTR